MITPKRLAYSWLLFEDDDEEKRNAFLSEIKATLPLMTWEGQVGLLWNAPPEVIVQLLPDVYWLAQVDLYNNLPVYLFKKAENCLDERAKVRLGLKTKKKLSKWTYRSMC